MPFQVDPFADVQHALVSSTMRAQARVATAPEKPAWVLQSGSISTSTQDRAYDLGPGSLPFLAGLGHGPSAGVGEVFIPPQIPGIDSGPADIQEGDGLSSSSGGGIRWMGETLDEAIQRFIRGCEDECHDLSDAKEQVCRNPKLSKEDKARCWKALYESLAKCLAWCRRRGKFAEGESAEAAFAAGYLKDLGDNFTALEEFALWVGETLKDVGKEPLAAGLRDPSSLPAGPTIAFAVAGAAIIFGGVLLLPVAATVGGATVVMLVPPGLAAALLLSLKTK